MLYKSLSIAKVITMDNVNTWIGNETIIVQVGDQIDSCRPMFDGQCKEDIVPNDKADDIIILEYMTSLNKKAMKDGGAIYSLLGNHEIMNVQGDFRYVSKNNMNKSRIHDFKPGNKYANFLGCTRQIALIIGSNLFVHAGILKEVANKFDTLEDINKYASLYLWNKLIDMSKKHILLNDELLSPIWTRRISNIKNTEECDNILNVLTHKYKVNNIYIGHTPQLNIGITSVCNKHIWKTDIGMGHGFDIFRGGKTLLKCQVLEIKNDNEFNILE